MFERSTAARVASSVVCREIAVETRNPASSTASKIRVMWRVVFFGGVKARILGAPWRSPIAAMPLAMSTSRATMPKLASHNCTPGMARSATHSTSASTRSTLNLRSRDNVAEPQSQNVQPYGHPRFVSIETAYRHAAGSMWSNSPVR